MKYPASTAKISYYRAKDIGANQEWIDWAFDMIESGFETESLLYLASFSASESPWHVREIGNKAFLELGIPVLEIGIASIGYAASLVQMALQGKGDYFAVLRILSDLYLDNDRLAALRDFDLLFCAKDALLESENQWYWRSANRENIDAVISEYFKEWLAKYPEPALPQD